MGKVREKDPVIRALKKELALLKRRLAKIEKDNEYDFVRTGEEIQSLYDSINTSDLNKWAETLKKIQHLDEEQTKWLKRDLCKIVRQEMELQDEILMIENMLTSLSYRRAGSRH